MNADPQRMCPTRVDGQISLFAHRISVAKCQEQQRNCYHKCYTCVCSNAHQAKLNGNSQRKRSASSNSGPLVEAPVEIPSESQVEIPVVAARESLPELPAHAAQFVPSMTE